MKNLIVASALAFSALMANASMTAKTTWLQRWPWDTKVDIDFSLAGGTKCDVAVTAHFTTNGVPVTLDLEHYGLVGDTWELEPGAYHLVWDPAGCGFDVKTLRDFSVEVTPVADPMTSRKYLVLNLVNGTWEYRSEAPAGGWFKADNYAYVHEKMVFARIPSGDFKSGLSAAEVDYLNATASAKGASSPDKTMTVSHDYYMAIYKMTVTQFHRIMNRSMSWTSENPQMDSENFYPLQRGSNSVDGINWPVTKFRVKEGTVISRMRNRSGNRLHIDLPTSAQWEKAARAGSSTFWWNGGTTGTSYQQCTNLITSIGYVKFMETGNPADTYKVKNVGQYLANGYGLYDVVGMRPEYVLDQFVDEAAMAAETVDPVGPSNGSSRIVRACHMQSNRSLMNFAHAYYTTEKFDNTQNNSQLSTRLAIHLRPPKSFGGKWE